MKNKYLKIVLGVVVAVLIAYQVVIKVSTYLGEQALEATGLHRYELTEALQMAKEKNRFILADMSAIWCPTCRKLDKKIFSDDSVKKVITDKYIFSRIEYESDQGKEFVKKYNVKGFPTLLILDKNAKKILQLPLTFDPELFIEYLNDFLDMQQISS